MSDKRPGGLRGLRLLGNLLVLMALLLALDYGWAWWQGTGTRSCAAVWAFAADDTQMFIGMGGLLLAIVGVMTGGARGTLTLLGLFIMVVGLIGSAMAPEILAGVCSPP